jgi:hypothetical protein
MSLTIIVTTEQHGRDWHATCVEQVHQANPVVGEAGPKRSEPAAASGAIGDFFRQRREAAS